MTDPVDAKPDLQSAARSEPVEWRCRMHSDAPGYWARFNDKPSLPYDIVEPLYTTSTPALAPQDEPDIRNAGPSHMTPVDPFAPIQHGPVLAPQDGGLRAAAQAVDVQRLSILHAQIPDGPYSADRRGDGHEVRALDTRPYDKHHWPYRLLASIPGQRAVCDDAVFEFVAGVVNAWPEIAAALNVVRLEGKS